MEWIDVYVVGAIIVGIAIYFVFEVTEGVLRNWEMLKALW